MKLFDLDAPTGGGMTIAEAMAKHGVQNESDSMVATPIDILEKKEEPIKPTEDSPVVTTNEPSTVEKANLETPSQVETIAEVHKPQEVVEQAKVPTLQEVLRNQQPDTVLKELGFDDEAVGFLKEYKELDPKMRKFLNTWKTGGDIKSYLSEMTTDYKTMPAEEVMRHQLMLEYPKASKQQLDVLYNREVTRAYSLDSVDEEEAAEGKMLLEAKADKYREVLLQKQSEKLLPPPPQPKPIQQDKAEADRLQQFEVYKSQITGNNYTKNIFANKSFSLGEGDEKFNFPVEPEAITDMLFTDKWQESLFNEDKSPKVEHQILVATVNKYGMKFISELAKHYKSLGGEKAIDPIENAKKPDGSSPSPSQAAPTNPAEAMARQGRIA